MSECCEEVRQAVWSPESVVQMADMEGVKSVKPLDEEERLLLAKGLTGLLVDVAETNPQSLLEAAARVDNLYGIAAVRRTWDEPPFEFQHVDVFAKAVLEALHQHPDQKVGAEAALMLRIGRNRASHKPSYTPNELDHYGPVVANPVDNSSPTA